MTDPRPMTHLQETTMHQHNPQTVDKVARAIANATVAGVPGWWETITGVHGSMHEQPDQVEQYRAMAHAALDAMPQPRLAAEVRRLRAAIAAADKIHKPHDCGCSARGLCDGCDSLTWPCPTHTALHPTEETDHA